MDNYQKEFIIYSVSHGNETELFGKLYDTACEVAAVVKWDYPVLLREYLETACAGLTLIDVIEQFHGVNPYSDEYEYIIPNAGDWEGMSSIEVKDWAKDMLDDNLEYCETKDIGIWDDEKFHEFMWNRYCNGDRKFMMSYYKDYDIYPYSSDKFTMIQQFVQRWGSRLYECEMLLFDDVLCMGHYMYSIKLRNTTWDEINIIQSHTMKPSLIDVLKALPKYAPGTFAEYCHNKGRDFGSVSWKLYSREKIGWEATMKLFPGEQARRELAAIF